MIIPKVSLYLLTIGIAIGVIMIVIFGNAKLPEMPITGQVFSILSLLLIAIELPIATNSGDGAYHP